MPVVLTSGATYPTLKYFTNGSGNSVLYSDDGEASIRLTGTVPATTTQVRINDYTLREYTA